MYPFFTAEYYISNILGKKGYIVVNVFASLFEAAMLSSSCSADAFAASFAYGSKGIRIPFLANQIINIICSSLLGLSLCAGSAVRGLLPGWLTSVICFCILFVLGTVKLLDSVTKSIIRRHSRRNGEALKKELTFSMFNFKFILNLYADPEGADVDGNKTISPAEAAILALSLSLDGLAVGFGAGLGNVSVLTVFFVSLVTNVAAVSFGSALGQRLVSKLPINLSWLGGAALIALAIIKLF